MRGMLLEVATSWADLTKEGGVLSGSAFKDWLPGLLDALTIVLWVTMALVGAAGGIYAVYVGIKMARADSAEQRDENKKRMINIIVAIVVTIVLIIFFNVFLPMIISAAMGVKYSDIHKGDSPSPSSIQAVVTAAKVLLKMPL